MPRRGGVSGRRRVRTEADLRRPSERRPPGRSILIVCEGQETEPNYLQSLWRVVGRDRPSVRVKVVGQGAEILGVVREAEALRDDQRERANLSPREVPYDEVWCVVDTEAKGQNASWNQGVHHARDKEVRLAWSNPCFEYWLLLHFERTGRMFLDSAAAIRALKKYVKHYEKKGDHFPRLASRVPTAIENSRGIYNAQWRDTPDPIDCNPGTTVHELVERLIEAAGLTIEEYRTRFPAPASR